MDQANPIIIVLMFVARCLVPLLIMLALSYLLRRLGLIKAPPSPPPAYETENGEPDENNQNKGDLAHGKV